MENKLTSKERSMLAAMSSKDSAIFQLGKDGISPGVIQGISAALTARELVKISVLKTAEKETAEYAGELTDTLNAQVVRIIGNKIILYRKSDKKGITHII